MERILVISDTHGRIDNAVRLMENVPFDKIIHLGDNVKDALSLGRAFPEAELIYVRGNNDPFGTENEKIIEIGNVKILACHGHTYSVSTDLLRISLAAVEKGAKVALFGHTHRKEDTDYNGVRLFNPGSASLPRDRKASCGIIEADVTYFGMAHYEF
ncbi:MAG: metallophosphoesterase [Clostridia bacterium]|nr:metallophosphoesterase [Clostridia bacterium]